MKKILFALAILSLGYINANAQSHKSIYDKNYPVCLSSKGTYKICPAPSASAQGRSETVDNTSASLRMMDTYVHMGYGNHPAYSNRHNPRIRVAIDDPHAAYEGKESMINDGVQKNKQRNINYLDTSVDLPPSDGGITNK